MEDFQPETKCWIILWKLECLYNFNKLASALSTGVKVSVSLRRELSGEFKVGNGVKQCCVLGFTLFLIFFLWFCLMLSLIPPKEYGYRVDHGQTFPEPVSLSEPERSEMFWYTSSCLLTILPSWHTTIKMTRK